MRITATVCLLLSLLIFGVATVTYIRGSYAYELTIAAEWSLADKSSTITAKAAHIDRFVEALDRQGLNGQYNAIVFPTPDNGFDQNFEALKTLQKRLHEIESMDVTSFQYQTAIQQITEQEQGEAQNMLGVFEGVWWKAHHFWLWDWVGALVWLAASVLLIAALGMYFIAADY